jgi:hypothetical protein
VSTPALPNLHDAVLESVVVDWSAGTASVECGTVDAQFVLVARHVRELRVDKREPWGPSDFINSVYVDENTSSEVAVYIEMQTGDDIFIVARELEVLESG